VKLRQLVDDQGEPLAPFDRPPAVWCQLGAPLELYDVEAGAAAELAAHGAVLGPSDAGYPGPADFYARRYWRRHRPGFLAGVGQLTPREAALLRQRRRRPR
jgi:hypothetical protein